MLPLPLLLPLMLLQQTIRMEATDQRLGTRAGVRRLALPPPFAGPSSRSVPIQVSDYKSCKALYYPLFNM